MLMSLSFLVPRFCQRLKIKNKKIIVPYQYQAGAGGQLIKFLRIQCTLSPHPTPYTSTRPDPENIQVDSIL
jgi:hypothetical protein